MAPECRGSWVKDTLPCIVVQVYGEFQHIRNTHFPMTRQKLPKPQAKALKARAKAVVAKAKGSKTTTCGETQCKFPFCLC